VRGLLCGLVMLGSAGTAGATPAVYGFNFPTWWHDVYSQAETHRSLELMAQTGAKWVALVPTWYQTELSDSSFAPTNGTASDESLRSVIRKAKALGLNPVLKPHVDAMGKGPRAFISPKDPKAWFTVYRRMAVHYARMAQEEGTPLYIVGTELFSLAGFKHRKEWVRVIAEVRAVYSGKITYAANWYDILLVSFWDKVDYIGIDGYFPVSGGSNLFLLKMGWRLYLPTIAGLHAAYGKPILFTEIGLSSQKGANLKPWEWLEFGDLDLEVQRAYMQSFIEVFEGHSWFAGLLYWGWETRPDAGGPKDKSMTVQGKPALDTLKAYFARRNGARLIAERRLPLPAARERVLRVAGTVPAFH